MPHHLHCRSPPLYNNATLQDAYAAHLARDDSGAIASFLEDATVRVLAASVAQGRGGQLQVRLANSTDFPAGCQHQITLIKPAAAAVQPSDVPRNIRIVTTAQSPLASLHRLLSELYCPMLGLHAPHGAPMQPHAAPMQQLPPHLQDLLMQVVAGLGAAARSSGSAHEAGEAAAGALTVQDELDHFAELAAGSPSQASAAAQQVSAHLERLRQPLQDLEAGAVEGGWEGAREVCSKAADALRGAWGVRGDPHPGGKGSWAAAQVRVQNVLVLLGSSVTRYCQAKLRAFDMWGDAFGVVKPQLIGAGQLLETWGREVGGLMADWRSGSDGSGRRWEGAAWVDARAAQLGERIEQVRCCALKGGYCRQLQLVGRSNPCFTTPS